MWSVQAQTEGLTLLVADNNTGYFGVRLISPPVKSKPYAARVKRGGKMVGLGSFVTAQEAALCVARTPEGKAAAAQAAAAELAAAAMSPTKRQKVATLARRKVRHATWVAARRKCA